MSYTTSAFLLWLLGYPDQAVERASSGEGLARQLNHPFTLAYARFHAGILDVWRRELERVRDRTSDALEIAEEHNYQVWRAVALVLHGVAMRGLDRPEPGLAQITRGMALYQGLRTPPVFWPVLLSLRARALAFAGRPADGLDAIDEAIAMTTEQDLLSPEFALLKGDLLLSVSEVGAAESWFQNAFDVAQRWGARMPLLEAATRLTRLRRPSMERPDGVDRLRGVYETFTEGFETRNLVEARALLNEV